MTITSPQKPEASGALYCQRCCRLLESSAQFCSTCGAPGPGDAASRASTAEWRAPAGGFPVESTRDLTLAGWLLLGGGVALVLGAFLPWATITAPLIGTVSKSGIDGGDGWIMVAVGLVLAVLGGRRLSSGHVVPFIPAAIVAVLGAALTLYELIDVGSASEGLATAHIGVGLWLGAAGVICAVVGIAKTRTDGQLYY